MACSPAHVVPTRVRATQVARRPQPQASHLRTSEVSRRRLKPEPPGPVRAAGPVRLPELEQQHGAAEVCAGLGCGVRRGLRL